MKIVFTAFNRKMWSKVQELPDNTSDIFYMPWPMSQLTASPKMDGSLDDMPPLIKRGKFEATGKLYHLPELGINEDGFAKEYILTDIDALIGGEL